MNRVTGSMLLVMLTCLQVFAADLTDSGRILRESTPPPDLMPMRKPPVFNIPEQQEGMVEQGGVRIIVSGFRFSGNSAITTQELERLVKGYQGRELTLSELHKIADLVMQLYRTRGYFLARAFIPAQTLKQGESIVIQVVEGNLEELKIQTSPPATRTPRWLMDGLASGVTIGSVVEDDSLTRASMLLNELPAISSRIVLEPGEKAGGTKAVIEVKEDKGWGLAFDADNAGNYSTGYYRVGASFELYSPLHLGDRLDLRFQSATGGDSQNLRFGYGVPVNRYGTRLDLNYSWVSYQLGRSYQSLDASGTAHDIGLTLSHPLLRSRFAVLNSTLGVNGKLLEDLIKSSAIDNSRHTVSVQVGLNGYLLDDLFTTDASTFFSAGFSWGQLDFDNQQAMQSDQAQNGLHTKGGYSKLAVTMGRTQNLFAGFSLYGSLNGQWGDKNLDSSEQLSLGGPNAVRAYPVGEASADLGVVFSGELRYLLPKLGPLPGNIQLSGFVDQGYAEIDAKPLSGEHNNIRNLTGTGFGFSWFDANNFLVKTSVAWRLSAPPTSDNTEGTKPTVYFQMIKRF
jgi:hemolysin activation/secretion protein